MRTQNTGQAVNQQYSLKEAVINEVNQLKANGSFSVHDVTSSIREAVNAGEYIIPGTEGTGAIKYVIQHEDVKREIMALLDDGTLNNLGLTNVNYNGTFRVFEFGIVPTPTTVQPTVATLPTPATVTPAVVRPARPVVVNANPQQGPVEQKIRGYITRAAGRPVTLRQIHSAIKVTGMSCKDLNNVVLGYGYTVTPVTVGAYSGYTVI